jgi:hypothetical protein
MMTISARAHAGILRTMLMQCGAGRVGGKGVISFYDGTRPASPDVVVKQSPLATVPIKRGSILVDEDGGADCRTEEGVIHRAGTALWARITNDGEPVFCGCRYASADRTANSFLRHPGHA